ncbi:MAG: glycosyltransferase family 9 protein [Ignavibacteria bacterium]|nr:glycosyltransferase family 9 protein [Ignavibacteria bacterium]
MKSILKKIISITGNTIFFFRKKNVVRSEVKKILVISLYFRGDALMNTPALRILSRIFPEAKTDIWIKSRSEGILDNNPHINKTIVFDHFKTADYNDSSKPFLKEKINFIKSVRNENYDLCIDLTGKYSTALFALLGGFKYSIGLNYNGFGFCYNKFVKMDTQHTAGHLAGKYTEVIRQGLELTKEEFDSASETDNFRNEIYISDSSRNEIRKILSDNGIGFGDNIISIQPSAGWKAKEWSGEKYSQLISHLPSGFKIVFIGSEQDAENIKSIIKNSNAPEKCIMLSLPMKLSAALISVSDIFIGSDSVGLQIAGAADVPSVALFGPTNPGFSNPPGEIHKIVYNKLFCSSPDNEQYCTRDAGKTCPDIHCMKSIQISDVVKQVNSLTENNTNKKYQIAE